MNSDIGFDTRDFYSINEDKHNHNVCTFKSCDGLLILAVYLDVREHRRLRHRIKVGLNVQFKLCEYK